MLGAVDALGPLQFFLEHSLIREESVSSCYHGSKISWSQHPFFTATAICIVKRWKSSMGYRFAPECNHTVRVSAKARLISSNTSTKPVSLGLTDLWNISLQNRSPCWPQFCFPRPQNKLAKSTHTSKVTSTFILALFKPGSTSGIISTHSLIGNLLQNPLAFSSPPTAR